MSDTPQTDEAQFGTGRVSVDFARRLERDLVEAREQRDRLAEALQEIAQGSACSECGGGNAVWLAAEALANVKGGNNE